MMKMLICALMMMLSTAAWADRAFPDDAKKGVIGPSKTPRSLVLNNKTTVRLSPGAKIRNSKNMIVRHSTIKENVVVKYKMEDDYLSHVWILTPDEIRDAGGAPVTTLPATD
jgi:hypothetical protein